MSTHGAQAAVVSLGNALALDGVAGPKTKAAIQACQRGLGLTADGVVGPLTSAALLAAIAGKDRAGQPGARALPADWMPAAQMSRIIARWTAGSYRPSGLDRSHYRLLIDGEGKLKRGAPSIDLNDARSIMPSYATPLSTLTPARSASRSAACPARSRSHFRHVRRQ